MPDPFVTSRETMTFRNEVLVSHERDGVNLLPVVAQPTAGRCASCRWWGGEGDSYSGDSYDEVLRPVDFDTNEPIPQPHEARYCNSPRLAFFTRPERDSASLFDGSQYRARLATGPDFGCLLWQGQP